MPVVPSGVFVAVHPTKENFLVSHKVRTPKSLWPTELHPRADSGIDVFSVKLGKLWGNNRALNSNLISQKFDHAWIVGVAPSQVWKKRSVLIYTNPMRSFPFTLANISRCRRASANNKSRLPFAPIFQFIQLKHRLNSNVLCCSE